MTRGRYEDYWLPGALCRFFAKKADKILEVRPQNYENATIYVVQRITNMGYTTTYTALREGDTVQAQWPRKIIVVPFSQLDES